MRRTRRSCRLRVRAAARAARNSAATLLAAAQRHNRDPTIKPWRPGLSPGPPRREVSRGAGAGLSPALRCGPRVGSAKIG